MILAAFTQLVLKGAVSSLPSLSFEAIPQILNPQHFFALTLLFCGLFAYAISMLCWFFALQSLPLNHAYPMLGLSYVLVYLSASALPYFADRITLPKTAGVGLILLGVWFIGAAVAKKDNP
ncbi:MAG: 4-amino-4-deoxy-L-arabinose-phosphoundecaprenol flippase subunit ArnF [Syntrophorhabdaceae bacterium]|nr:4-amino-4-deoxy-L-arabinose-phosphoundecaprenol flippase subunit ArnF [Syntrophorhabdaceae bacterium]